MKEMDKRKLFQRIKSMSLEHFWNWMTIIHSDSYSAGMKHVIEAMEMHPRIYKPMVKEVLAKAREIRENWDDVKETEVTEDELEQIRQMIRPKKEAK